MTSSGVLPIRSQGYYIALQYPDEAQPQVVRLSEPTVECLKETIDKDTDMFLNRDIDILYELNHVLMKLTAVPEQVTELIKRSSFQNMECFHVRPKKRRTPPVRTLSTPTLLPPHSGSSKVYDGFLSYQWGCQDMAKRIVDDLTQLHNLVIWMDLDDMSGAIGNSMAEGIDSSEVFIPILTLDYQRSVNCMLEMRYAKERRKPQVPIRLLKQGEDPKGEAFAITAGLLYFNFEGKTDGSQDWNETIMNLANEIKSHLPSSPQTPARLLTHRLSIPQVPDEPLKAWLDPVDASSDMQKHANAYVAGTRQSHLEHVFHWLESSSISNMLWLNGGAGVGKSVIAWLVCKRLPQDYILGSVFFCHHDDAHHNNPQRLVATMVYNLCHALPSFRIFCDKWRLEDLKNVANGDESILKDPQLAFEKLVIGGLHSLSSDDLQKKILLVIDALDECGVPQSKDRDDLLDLLSNEAMQLPPTIRIFATGRPERDIFDTMVKMDSMVLATDRSDNMEDMKLFVKARLARKRMSDSDLEMAAQEIFTRSSGVFQFARLVCDELESAEPADILRRVAQFNSGMDGVYEQFFSKHSINANNFRLIMKIVLAAKEPLRQDDIAELLGVKTYVVGQVLLEIHRILDHSDSGKVKVMHKSLADHLSSPERCVDPHFYIDITEANMDISLGCIRTILKHQSSINNKYEALNGTQGYMTQDILAQYAFKYWFAHLDEMQAEEAITWQEWKNFCSPSAFGAAALCYGIVHKKEWLVTSVLSHSGSKSLAAEALGLNVLPSALLYECATRGLTQACKALIEVAEEDVDCRGHSWGHSMQYGEENRTALMIAAQGGHSETVTLLLDKGANPHLTNASKFSAADFGCSLQIRNWIEKEENTTEFADFFRRNNDWEKWKHWLMDQGASVLAVDETGRTPLHFASQHGHTKVVEWLLQQGSGVDATDRNRWTPLHFAASHGHLEVCKLLVRHGASVGSEIINKGTSLHMASQHGHLEVVRWLLAQGANSNALDLNKWTPLHQASAHGHLDVTKVLLSHGANPNAETTNKGTPLHNSAHRGHDGVVRWLLQSGALVNAEDSKKWTPLYVASQSGHLEVVRSLLLHGASVGCETVDRWTPLHIASRNGHLEVVKWLLRHGANVNAKNMKLGTALHNAALRGHLEVVKWLVQHGADVNAQSDSRWTPLFVALVNKHHAVAHWLEQHGGVR